MTTYPLTFPQSNKVAGQAGFIADIDAAYNALQALAGVNVLDSQWAGGADPTGSADSSAAFLAAMASAGAGTTYVPAGTYKIAAQLAISSAMAEGTLQGSGPATVLLWDGVAVPTLFAMADTTQRRYNIRDLQVKQVNASAAGTAVNGSYLVYSELSNLLITGSTKNPNQGIILSSSTTFYNWIRNCRVNIDGAGAAGISFTGGANNNRVQGGRVFISASDSSQTAYVVNAKSCALYSPNCQGGAGIGLDVQSGGVACTVVDPYFENNATANYRLASGLVAFTSIGGTVENDSAYTPNITDNGATFPFILNARTSHGGDQADTRGVIAAVPQPEDHGLIGWAYDPATISNGSALTAGTAYFVKVPVRRATTISKLWVDVTTAATSITASENFVGLYTIGSTTATLQQAASADTIFASTGVQSVSITGTVVAPGYVLVGFFFNATGTALSLGRNAAGPAVGNVGLAAAGYRFFSNTTGNTTALPGTITLSGNSLANAGTQDYWAAVS